MSKLQLLICNAIRMVDAGKIEADNSDHYGLIARGLMFMAREIDGDIERFRCGLNGDVDHAELFDGLMAGIDRPGQLLTLLANAMQLSARGLLCDELAEHIGTFARALCALAIEQDGDRERFDEALFGEVRYVGRLRQLLKGVCRYSEFYPTLYGNEAAMFA